LNLQLKKSAFGFFVMVPSEYFLYCGFQLSESPMPIFAKDVNCRSFKSTTPPRKTDNIAASTTQTKNCEQGVARLIEMTYFDLVIFFEAKFSKSF